MKLKLITIGLILPALFSSAENPTMHPDLAAARSRFESAMAAATKPVRERYILELQQLKNRAMTMKNLELAVAIDQEIKIAGVAPKTEAKSSLPSHKLSILLPGTRWTSDKPGFTPFDFKDGTTVFWTGNGTATAYVISKDGNTVSFKYTNGKDGMIKFSADRREFEYGGAIYKQSK